jgi:regulator of replication initiation timing
MGESGVPTVPQPSAVSAGKADDLFVVDCLLPGRVQKLGRRLTYLTPRQPVKTTAQDCEIRGGEYTAYDRSNYATALKIWLPQAQEGDKVAQTYVGEIYERGVGGQPDYALAGTWYRKAAEQGYTRAQINLAHLYETGLGVEKDPVTALRWYRQAAGLSEPIALDPGTLNAPVNTESQALKQEVARLTRETETLRQELERTRQQLEQARRELDRRQSEAETERRAVEAARQELEQRKQQAAAPRDDTALKQLEAQLTQRQTDLERHRQEIAQLRQHMAQLEAETERYRTQLASAPAPQVPLPAPTIELIDPPLVKTRALLVAQMSAGRKEASRVIVGRVTAPAGVLAFTVNDREEQLATNGIFRVPIPLREPNTPVQVVAVDKQGKRGAVDFQFTVDSTLPPVPPPTPKMDINFGTYYALIIGNQQYLYVSKLETPENDARSIAEVLSRKYGFKTKVLLNATSQAIVQALNDFRRNMTDKDNLLIYYAGHGHLEEKIKRGYWVPVDGEKDNPTNWISTVTITDFLGLMAAKHVLVVADSCYAGALLRSGIASLETGMSDEARQHWLTVMAKKPSRTILASGGLEPILDSGGGGHSVLAKAFLDVLNMNGDILEGQQLYNKIAARVSLVAETHGGVQTPEYAHLHYVGDESGDFLFVPSVN